MKKIINQAVLLGKESTSLGKVANYIPELAKCSSDALGIYIKESSGEDYYSGDYDHYFTMQSISKVISLILALEDNTHDYVFEHVGVSASAESFNSIIQLETKNGHIPLNPFINAGAILTLSMVRGSTTEDKFIRIIELAEKLMGRSNIEIDELVYQSEKETGDRNRALAYFMRSTKIYTGDVESVLDIYFRMCSLKVTCKDIANIGFVLSQKGFSDAERKQIISEDTVRVVNAIMASCGMYDGSGQYAIGIGMPSKSGVGGGIMAIAPNRMGIGVYGPSLDDHGNSIAGISMLKYLSKKLNLSIY